MLMPMKKFQRKGSKNMKVTKIKNRKKTKNRMIKDILKLRDCT